MTMMIEALEPTRGILPTGPVDLSCPLSQVRSGRDLGIRAHYFLVKSAEGILEVARCVATAYDRWYRPYAKAGRKTKAAKGDVVRQNADREYRDFLDAAGWDATKHAKLLRKYAEIGRRADLLTPNLANLPNSVEAMAIVACEDLKDEQVLQIITNPITSIKDANAAVELLVPKPTAAGNAPDEPVNPAQELKEMFQAKHVDTTGINTTPAADTTSAEIAPLLNAEIQRKLKLNEYRFQNFRTSNDVRELMHIFYDFQRFLRSQIIH